MGASGVWLAFLLGELLTLLTVGLVLMVKNGKGALSMDSIMMLDKTLAAIQKTDLKFPLATAWKT